MCILGKEWYVNLLGVKLQVLRINPLPNILTVFAKNLAVINIPGHFYTPTEGLEMLLNPDFSVKVQDVPILSLLVCREQFTI